MEDLSQKISELLSDPSTLEKIKGLTGLLGQSDLSENATPNAMPDPKPAPCQPKNDFINPELLGTVMKVAPLLQSINQEDDSTRLLKALKPFLSAEKCKKVDEAIKLLGIFKMLPIIKSVGFDLG